MPIGHAADGGGSIRIPAACCGLVGLKPTRARNSLGPVLGDIMGGLVVEHVVTRSVRDSAAVLDCTAGPMPGEPYWAPPPERPFLDEVDRDPGSLRVAYWAEPMMSDELDPECVTAVESTAGLLAELGHVVEAARPAIDDGAFADAFTVIWTAGCAATLDGLSFATGRKPEPDLFEPLTWAFYEQGKQVAASEYQLAILSMQVLGRQMAAFLSDFDVWLTPTLGARPLRLGVLDSNETDVEKATEPLITYIPYTPIFNATGQPAISLPLHQSSDGLPVGVHLGGRFGEEGLLLRLSAQLEQARPWLERKPPIWD